MARAFRSIQARSERRDKPPWRIRPSSEVVTHLSTCAAARPSPLQSIALWDPSPSGFGALQNLVVPHGGPAHRHKPHRLAALPRSPSKVGRSTKRQSPQGDSEMRNDSPVAKRATRVESGDQPLTEPEPPHQRGHLSPLPPHRNHQSVPANISARIGQRPEA
jgi:hypothetical protein